MRACFLVYTVLGLSLASMGSAPPTPKLLSFSLDLTEVALRNRLGDPDHVREQAAYRVWDYNLGPMDENDMDFGWSFYFEQPSGHLVSVTHNIAKGTTTNGLFAANRSRSIVSPAPGKLPMLYQLIGKDGLLLGVGVSNADQLCNQLILMRRSAVNRFYPWLASQLQ